MPARKGKSKRPESLGMNPMFIDIAVLIAVILIIAAVAVVRR